MTKKEEVERLEPLSGHRQWNERDYMVSACNDWLRLGVGRSLRGLLEWWGNAEKYQGEPPTTSLTSIKQWSTRFGWMNRAAIYDARMEEDKNAAHKAVFEAGLALEHERVMMLMELAEFLGMQVYEQDSRGRYQRLWVRDVKQIGSGDDAERVDVFRFNSPLVSELRGILDDIAKETGGRRIKQDVNLSGEVRVPIQYIEVVPPSDDSSSDPQT